MDKEIKEAIDHREIRPDCIKNFWDAKQEIALLKQTICNMEKHFERIEELIEWLPGKLKDVFATKKEINENKLLIAELKASVKFHWMIIYWAWWIVTAIITYLVTKTL
jgi:hypothetical protein